MLVLAQASFNIKVAIQDLMPLDFNLPLLIHHQEVDYKINDLLNSFRQVHKFFPILATQELNLEPTAKSSSGVV